MPDHRKYLLIGLVLIILAGGGVSWLTAKPPTGPPGEIKSVGTFSSETAPKESADETLNLLNRLQQQTQINFSEIKTTEFSWNSGTDQIDVSGIGFSAWEISDAQQKLVENFFENRGFETDLYNVYAGTTSGAAGYKRDSVVCLVVGGVSGGEEGLQREPVVYDVEVRCGLLSPLRHSE